MSTIIIISILSLIIIIGFIYNQKILALFQSSNKKSTKKCQDDPDKNNLSYLIEKSTELRDLDVIFITSFAGMKLYKPSDYDKKMNDFISSVQNKNEARNKIKAAYDKIMKELGPPQCILTEKQLTACKQVVEEINKNL